MAHELAPASSPHQDTERKNSTNPRKPVTEDQDQFHPLDKPIVILYLKIS